MEGFVMGFLLSGVVLGFILKAVGKHDETKRAMKNGGLAALQWWLRR